MVSQSVFAVVVSLFAVLTIGLSWLLCVFVNAYVKQRQFTERGLQLLKENRQLIDEMTDHIRQIESLIPDHNGNTDEQ